MNEVKAGAGVSRRGFLKLAACTGMAVATPLTFATIGQAEEASKGDASGVPDEFPRQDPEAVRETVSVAHFNFDRLKELVTERPALAKASWDWGYGDWETPLGAASHMGHRDMAEFLLAHGARPNVFSAAMLGQLSVVRAFVEADEATVSIEGPHGISLLSHARAGKEAAAEVLAYLESRGAGKADATSNETAHESLTGRYAFGPHATDVLLVSDKDGLLRISREGQPNRYLQHIEGTSYHPAGVSAVRVTFRTQDGRASRLTVHDGPLVVTAKRVDD